MFCAESVPSQFHSIGHLKRVQHPGNATLDLALCEVQLAGDFLIVQALTSQMINGSQHVDSLPVDSHVIHLPINFFISLAISTDVEATPNFK
jgi:hypothetical protein